MARTLSRTPLKIKPFALLLLCVGVFASYGVLAKDSPVNRVQTRAAQEQTVRALQMVHQGQWGLASKVIAQTRDPLAAKLYYWLVFSRKGDFENFGRLAHFIRQNPEWPGIGALRSKAESEMPSGLRPDEVLGWFADYKPQTANGVDRYMQALIGSGRSAEAKKFLADWWAGTTLSRDDQRFIFKKYSRYLDRAAHLRRFDTMLYRGQDSNAKALAQVLGHGYPQLAAARIALRAEKKNVNGLISAVPAKLKNDPGLMYERLRWRRKNDLDEGALEILRRPPPADKIQNLESWWQERHIMIRRMLEKRQYKAAYALAAAHMQKPGGFPYAQAQWMAGWLALEFVHKPTEAYQYFEALYQNVQTPISKSRGSYWAGRAAEEFGNKAGEGQTLAQGWFQKAAQYQTTYYGQLAGAKLGLKEALRYAAPPKLTREDLHGFGRKELVQASYLFHRAGMKKESRRFLQAFIADEGSAKAYRYAVDLALKNGQLYEAVKVSKDATKKGLFLTAQSYPVLSKPMPGVNLEWSLVHAIIRQESVFDLDARSPAGALGLMQLMPGTAREVARKVGVPYNQGRLTRDKSYNIRLGSRYLDDLVRRYNGAYPLAIAAYNAGPGRVDRWLKTFGDPRMGGMDWINWMEMIPIYETRNYVQRVLEGVYVYRLRLQKVQPAPDAPIHIALSEF